MSTQYVFPPTIGRVPGYEPEGSILVKRYHAANVNYVPTPAYLPALQALPLLPASVLLKGSVFSPVLPGTTHANSRFQVDFLSGNFSAPLYDSGWVSAITSLTVNGLPLESTLKARLMYRGSDGATTAWATPPIFDTAFPPTPPALALADAPGRFSASLAVLDTDAQATAAVRVQAIPVGGDWADAVDTGWLDAPLAAVTLSEELEAGTEYEARAVRLSAWGLESEWSEVFLFETAPPAPTGPPPKSEVGIIALDRTILTVGVFGLPDPDDDVTEIRVVCMAPGQTADAPFFDSGWQPVGTGVALPPLVPSTEYRIIGTRRDSLEAEGEWSEEIAVILNAGGGGPVGVRPALVVTNGQDRLPDYMVNEDLTGNGFRYPLMFSDLTGGVAYVRAVESVKASLLRLFDTMPGEEQWNPGYGCALKSLLFEEDTEVFRALCQTAVRDAVRKWEPRVEEILDVFVQEEEDNPHQINLQVFFRLVEGRSTENLVYVLSANR
jgi:uncharacterized protein